MSDPFQVVRDFEAALCEYTGAPFAVTTTSCTDALKLAVAWHTQHMPSMRWDAEDNQVHDARPRISIPKRTYVGVAMAIIHAGGRPTFRDQNWRGAYPLRPLPVWDSARWFTGQLFTILQEHDAREGGPDADTLRRLMVCVSFHWSKTLGISQGGAILHDDPEADRWLRKARFDGREEGVAPKDQEDWILGHHCYMAPETAAAGLVRMRLLPQHNEPLPNDDYPDLSKLEIFR